MKTLKQAAWELDAIRNDLTATDEDKLARVDQVGFWLASQKRTALGDKLLKEAHQIVYGKSLVRIV